MSKGQGAQHTVKGIPSDVFTTEDRHRRRIRTSAVNRPDVENGRGKLFYGSTTRVGVSINDTYYSVVTAPSNQYLIVEDLEPAIDLTNLGAGFFTYTMDVFIKSSVTNTWSHTEGTQQPLGRPMNTEFINVFTDSTIELDVAGVSLTGDPDYLFLQEVYVIDSAGNRSVLTSLVNTFFRNNRRLIVAPNEQALIRVRTGGTATGTVDPAGMFFVSETGYDGLDF